MGRIDYFFEIIMGFEQINPKFEELFGASAGNICFGVLRWLLVSN